MEGYSRFLLAGFGGVGDEPRRVEHEPRSDMETEAVELSLGLSLGGRFGMDKSGGERLGRSSSVMSILATEEVAPTPTPPALARTSSLPIMADVEAEKKQRLGDWSGWRGNAVGVEASAKPPVVPRSGSHWNGVKLEPSVKLPGNGFKVETSVKLPGNGFKVETSVKLPGNGFKVDPAAKLPWSGSSSSGSSNNVGKRLAATHIPVKQSLPSAVFPPPPPPLAAGANSGLLAGASSSTVIAAPSFAALAAAIVPSGEQQLLSGGHSSARDEETMIMEEMPCVCTRGLPNGRRVDGILYKHRKLEDLRIVCLCHGSFLTPVEFVRHAGGGDANPLKHIIVNPSF